MKRLFYFGLLINGVLFYLVIMIIFLILGKNGGGDLTISVNIRPCFKER